MRASTQPLDPTADAAATGTPGWLHAELIRLVEPARVLTRPIDLVMFASDASFYRMIPKAVVLADGVSEIRALFELGHRSRIPLTFRAAGTSLSGQAQSDGILVEVARHWRGVTVEDGGSRVRVKPGTIAARVNLALRPHGRKIGPDPASISACTIGGIVANNSSGMCCGVEQNAYHTLRSLTFVLPSGTVIDTGAPGAAAEFARREPRLVAGLREMREQIAADPTLSERVRAKYRMKNTTGYGLNAFLDFAEPLDIFAHLLVGSEGTLAFVAEVVFETVPDLPHRITGLLIFEDLHAAGAAIVPLRDAGATAIELMDRASLRAVEAKPGVPGYLAELPDGAAALLVDFATADPAELPRLEQVGTATADGLRLLRPVEFTADPVQQGRYWTIRSGLFTSVGAARPSGTSVLLEDVTFPVDRLADAVVDLTELFAAHGYPGGVVFGHAKDGNLHFLLTQSLNEPTDVDRYARFMDAMVELVAGKYGGALKGEHGTGRNVAPFVEAEWGPVATELMRRLKELADPDGLLNPGVVVNPDPQAHLRYLKTTPTIEDTADRCIECGYCEHVCPSRELTTTPRQRIVIRREMVRQAAAASQPAGDPDHRAGAPERHRGSGAGTPLLAALRRDYDYMAMQTCAADGMCELACPVDINTGELVKRFRHQQHSARAEAVARQVAERYRTVERVARLLIGGGRLTASGVGDRPLSAVTGLLRSAAGADLVPHWDPDLPAPAPARLPVTSRAGAQAVYFPACVNRIFGPGSAEPAVPSLPEALVALAHRAGVPLVIPADVAGACCGTPWRSKGYTAGTEAMSDRTVARAWEWSEHGRLPIVVDASSCAHGLRECRQFLSGTNKERFDRLTFLDSIDFVHDILLPSLGRTGFAPDRRRSAVLHPVCSVHHLRNGGKLEAIAAALADNVVVPAEAGCCAFAGDRGWLHPELTATATRHEAAEVTTADYDAYLCSNRTCEIGLARATGKPYRSFVHLLEEATRALDRPSPT